jgi:thioredoxin 1
MSKAKKTSTSPEKKSGLGEEIKSKDKAIVLFYATWCPFSRHFLPIFTEYSKSSPKECLRVVVDEEPELCDEYGIEIYPTVLMIENGKIYKRLDSEPHVYLTKEQLKKFTEK